MTRNEYLHEYLKFGWTIIPVVSGEKRPAVNWKDYQNKKPTNTELKEWFKDPNTGVGLITGKASGVIVVDEDSYKEKGTVLTLETPLKVKTGGGGTHYYFKYKEGVTNAVNRDKAVDVRGEGGFVVLPPTIHPNGNAYKWEGELPENLDNLPTLDESFADEMVKSRTENNGPLNISDYLDIGEGSRNDSLHRIACSILNKVPEKEALRLIYAANQTYDPPLSDRDVETIIRSAKSFISAHPKENFIEKKDKEEHKREPLKILSYSQAKQKYEELMKKYGEGITTGYMALDRYFKFIPQQLYMISASTHVGKTTIVLNIAGRVARAGYKVTIASLEQGVFVVPRIESMFSMDEKLNNISFIAPQDMPKPEDFTTLLNNEEIKPKLLIIDHLHYFERGNKGATEEMDRLVVRIQMMANKLEIPVVVVAHVRKMNQLRDKKTGREHPPTMEDLKDSSSLSQIPSVVMMMHREKSSEEDILHGTSVFSDQGTLFIYKNRIYGKTGAEDFKIFDNGEIIFNKEPQDKINPAAESISGLEDFFDDK